MAETPEETKNSEKEAQAAEPIDETEETEQAKTEEEATEGTGAATEEEPKEEAVEEALETEKPETAEEELEKELEEFKEEEKAAEEEKPKRKEEKAEEEDIVEERIYTIPLRKAWIMPPIKRTPRAVRILRDFIHKHMKVGAEKEGEEEMAEEEKPRVIISEEVNERLWGGSIEKPPRKIRVRAVKDKDGNVTVYLAEGD